MGVQIRMRKISGLFVILMCLSGVKGASVSMEHEEKAKPLVFELKKLIQTPEVLAAVKEQNQKHAALTQDDINALDKRWLAKDSTLINPTVQNQVSNYLRKLQLDSKGMYLEIFVMDNRGLNVGQSGPTSDYWQGDEDKWLKTFKVGPDAVHISKIEYDDSTKMFQFQLSFPVVDAGEVIGAVTFGINWNLLKQSSK